MSSIEALQRSEAKTKGVAVTLKKDTMKMSSVREVAVKAKHWYFTKSKQKKIELVARLKNANPH